MRRTLLEGALLLVLAALPRLSTFPDVREGRGWVLRDGDSYYHLRRIEQTIARGGRVPMFDPDLSFPDGQRLQWHAGYDLLIAGVVRASCGPSPDRGCLMTSAVVTTPILGLMATLLVWLLGRAAAGRWPGLLAGALFALYPFSAGSAALGHVDHHVLEPALVALWCFLLVRERSVAAGLVAGLSFAVFPTALFPVLATIAALGADALFFRRSLVVPIRFALVTLVTVLPIILTGAFPDRMEPMATSWFHAVVLSMALLVLLTSEATRRISPGRPQAVTAACVAAVAALVVAGLAGWLDTLGRFAEAQQLWTGIVQQRSLGNGRIANAVLGIVLGGACLGAAVLARAGDGTGMRVVALVALPLSMMSVAQIRFLMMASAPLVVVIVYALNGLRRHLRERLAEQPARTRRLGEAVVAGLALLALLPMLEYVRPYTRNGRWMRPTVTLIERLGRHGKGARQAVLSDWMWGHHVLFLADLPTVASPFIMAGDDQANREARLALLTDDPKELYRTMQRRGCGYLLISGKADVLAMARSVGIRAPSRPAVTELLGTHAGRWSRLTQVDVEGSARLFRFRARDPAD